MRMIEIIKKRRIMILTCSIVFLLIYIALYPLYVKAVCNWGYALNFAKVLDTHDLKVYDMFFSKDTVFNINGEEMTYLEFRERIADNQGFDAYGSYGHVGENSQLYGNTEFTISLMLPIEGVFAGYESKGMNEGEIIVKNYGLLFFKIEYFELEIY